MIVCVSVGSDVEGLHVYQTGSQSRNAVGQEVKEAADLCRRLRNPVSSRHAAAYSILRRRLGSSRSNKFVRGNNCTAVPR